MNNEMRRPCIITHPVVVNDGKPFDIANGITAYAVASSYYYMAPVCVDVAFMGEPSGDWEDSKAITLPPSAILQLAQALNPPIKVTQAVLNAMEKVPNAKFLVCEDDVKYPLDRPCNTYYPLDDAFNNGRYFDMGGKQYYSNLQIGDYIQADCPLALQVLLQFNTEGELFDA